MVRKEQVYINLQGKTKEELTEINNILDYFKQVKRRDNIIEYFDEHYDFFNYLHFNNYEWVADTDFFYLKEKQEVTIEQLKEILQPMETFTPIAMKCTQEQFDAIKPKLKGCEVVFIYDFDYDKYLVNNGGGVKNRVTNVSEDVISNYNRVVYEEWNEEVFLKACGIEVESLEQQLEKAKAEVERLEKEIEESKIKAGDWVVNPLTNIVIKVTSLKTKCPDHYKKITNPQLIELLNKELW